MRTLTTLLLVTLTASACDLDDDAEDPVDTDADSDGVPDDIDSDMGTDGADEWRANLVGVAPYTTVSGSALVRQAFDESILTVTITLRGDYPEGAVRPWHVHAGDCDTGGPIIGPPGAYPALTVGGDGFASRQTRIVETLDVSAAYHVNVHASPDALETIVACGDLVSL